MKKEQLIELGIEDEKVQKELFKLHGLGIEAIKAENTELSGTVENLTSDLSEAQRLIEDFGKKELDFEEITKTAEAYKAKFEEADATRAAEVEQLKFDHALNDALRDASARNTKAVKALLDMENLKLGKDGIDGLAEQLEEIMVENDFLFDGSETSDDEDPADEVPDEETPEEPPARRIVAPGQSRKIYGDPIAKAARDGAGLD